MKKNVLFSNTGILVLLQFIVAISVILPISVQPKLLYHLQQPPFFFNSNFFKNFLEYPGGLNEYLSAFLSQFFSFNFIGSLVILSVGVLITILCFQITRLVFQNTKLNVLHIAPFMFLLSLMHKYTFPFATALILLFSALSTWIYLLLHNQNVNRFISFGLLALFTYYFAGSGALSIFGANIIFITLFSEKKKVEWIVILYALIIAVVFPFLGYKYVFNIPFDRTYFSFMPELLGILAHKTNLYFYLFLVSLPVIIIISAILSKIVLNKKADNSDNVAELTTKKGETKEKEPIEEDKNQPHEKEKKFHAFKDAQDLEIQMDPISQKTKQRVTFSVNLVIHIILLIIVFSISKNSFHKNIVLTDYYTYHEDWEKAKQVALSEKNYNELINFNYNRAITNQGKLADELFKYPQQYGPDIMNPSVVTGPNFAFISSDYYYDLGYMSEALHWAHEAQSYYPNSPRAIKRKVEANLVFGNYKTAKKNLLILNDNFLYKKFVKKYMPLVEDTSLIVNYNDILEKRTLRPKNITTAGFEQNAVNLLKENPKNKSAYEHLMMYYLLDNQLADFMKYFIYGRTYYKNKVPSAFEQGLLAFTLQTKPDKIKDVKTSLEAKQMITTYIQLKKKNKNNLGAAKKEMYKYIGDSYLYYLTFYLPEARKRKLTAN